MPERIQDGPPIARDRWNWVHLCSRDAFWMGVLACLNVAFFSEVLFTHRTFFVRDVSTFHYPLKKLVTEAYAHGEWPLWNPYIQMGQPLLANPNSMAVYPGQLLFQLLPFEQAFELHFVLHCALAGMGAFCLARRLRFSVQAAFLSAVIYNFSGLTLSAVNLFNILPVVAFLPWLSVSLLWLASSLSIVPSCVTALLLGTFFLLLEPLSTIAAGLFLLVLLGGFIWRSGQVKVSIVRIIGVAVVVLLAALSIAAVQILPTLELVQFSGRKEGLGFSEATFWSLHPVQALQVFCPRILGEYFRLEAPVPWPARFFDQREPYLLSCYFGGMTLMLATCGAWRWRRDWTTHVFVLALGVSVLLALGLHTPLYAGLFKWLPMFRYGRFPVKFLFVPNLCVSLLAGTGWAALQAAEDTSGARRRRWLLIALMLVLSAALATLYRESAWKLIGATRTAAGEFEWSTSAAPVRVGPSLIFDGVRHVQLHLGMFLVLLLIRSWRVVRPAFLGVSLVIVVLLDLWSSNLWINPAGDARLYETAPVARYLQERERSEGPFRIYRYEPPRLSQHPSIRYETDSVIWISLYRKLTLYPFLAAKDHVAYSLFPTIDRLETPFVQQLSRGLEASTTLHDRLDILSELNVSYVVSPVELASNQLDLEGLFQVNSDQPLRLYRLAAFQRRAVVIRQSSTSENSSPDVPLLVAQPANGPLRISLSPLVEKIEGASAKISSYSNGYVQLDVETPQDGLLLLLDNNYPGWVARVDGELREIRSIHPASRGVGISRGGHQITFSFEPRSFRLGLLISTVSICLVFTILVAGLFKNSMKPMIHP